MKIKEILAEGVIGQLPHSVDRAIPNTWVLPALRNQDPYIQYRMGVALASARSGQPMDTVSAFGENMTIVTYTDADNETVELALKLMGKKYAKGARSVSGKKSEEAVDTNTTSTVSIPKRNKYGV
jgi:hypothetical protein